MSNLNKGGENAVQEQATKTAKEVTSCGAEKSEYLANWGYVEGTPEAEEAWRVKVNHDAKVSNIPNPNKPHNRMVELPSYQSPVTGKWIDGRVARRNDLAASGCVEFEPGMKEEQAKRYAREDAALDKKVEDHVEETIYKMPTEKREKLFSELEHSDVDVVRT